MNIIQNKEQRVGKSLNFDCKYKKYFLVNPYREKKI